MVWMHIYTPQRWWRAFVICRGGGGINVYFSKRCIGVRSASTLGGRSPHSWNPLAFAASLALATRRRWCRSSKARFASHVSRKCLFSLPASQVFGEGDRSVFVLHGHSRIRWANVSGTTQIGQTYSCNVGYDRCISMPCVYVLLCSLLSVVLSSLLSFECGGGYSLRASLWCCSIAE